MASRRGARTDAANRRIGCRVRPGSTARRGRRGTTSRAACVAALSMTYRQTAQIKNAAVIQIGRIRTCGASDIGNAPSVHGKLVSSEPSVPRGFAIMSRPVQTERSASRHCRAVHRHALAETPRRAAEGHSLPASVGIRLSSVSVLRVAALCRWLALRRSRTIGCWCRRLRTVWTVAARCEHRPSRQRDAANRRRGTYAGRRSLPHRARRAADGRAPSALAVVRVRLRPGADRPGR